MAYETLKGLVRAILYAGLLLAAAILVAAMGGPCLGDEIVMFRVTAYCPCDRCCGAHADGITASGARADHPLAAAPKRFPFGTRLKVPGYAGGRWVRVEDRGGTIKGNRLDVLFFGPKAHERALEWGVRHVSVRIRRKG